MEAKDGAVMSRTLMTTHGRMKLFSQVPFSLLFRPQVPFFDPAAFPRQAGERRGA